MGEWFSYIFIVCSILFMYKFLPSHSRSEFTYMFILLAIVIVASCLYGEGLPHRYGFRASIMSASFFSLFFAMLAN